MNRLSRNLGGKFGVNAMSVSRGKVVLGRSVGNQNTEKALSTVSPEDEVILLKKALADLQREVDGKEGRIRELESALLQSQEEIEIAQSSLTDIQSDLANRQNDAAVKGYDEGMRKSAAELRDAQADQANIWQRTIVQLSEQHDEFCSTLKSQIVDVVMAAVAKIIGDQLTNVEAVKRGIEHIVRESGELQSFKIFIAPAQYDQLMACTDFKLDLIAGRKVELFPDTRLEHGGCILEGASGLIDGRYEIQLSRLRTLLQASASELVK